MSNIEDTKPIDVLATRVWAGTHYHYPHIERMIAELSRLRQLEADAKAANMLGSDGRVRRFARRDDRMPSTLEINNDGEIVGHGAIQWRYNKATQEIERLEFRLLDTIKPSRVVCPEVGHSTREAAEAAKATGGGA